MIGLIGIWIVRDTEHPGNDKVQDISKVINSFIFSVWYLKYSLITNSRKAWPCF